jgi:hypothetical protein
MSVGDLNKKFGWLWILIAPLMGIYISFQFQNVEGYAQGFARTGNRLFHAHAGILSVINILYGYGIDEVGLAENAKKLGAYLAIVGTLFVSLSFMGSIVSALGAISFPIRIIGFISLFVAILILASGMLKK